MWALGHTNGSLVWELTTSGKLIVVHSTDQISDGGLTIDCASNLYGATYRGGKYGQDSIFKLTLGK